MAGMSRRVGHIRVWGRALTLRRHRHRYLRTAAAVATGVLVLPNASLAADLPLKARAARTLYDWTGFYVGGHFGYGDASFGPGTNPLPEQGALLPHSATGLTGGYQLGYNRQFANRVVLGVEADATFPSPTDGPALARSPALFHTTIDYVGTVRGRIGYAFDRLMPYVTGGFAWGHTHINVNDGDGVSGLFPVGHYQTGWTAGVGLEYAVSGNWTAKAEYEYVDLSRQTYDLSGFGLGSVNVDPRIHLFKLGLNYQFGDTPWMPPVDGKTKLPEFNDWNVHAQTTVLPQGYGPIHSPYASPFSLPGSGQFQATWTTTAFLGARLWDGGEFYFNPELAQGFGLNGTLGLAGFSNGEAQKAGAPFPKIRAAALLSQADVWARRRAGGGRRRAEPARGKTRRRSRHADRRALRDRRLLRRQLICKRPAGRLHELGDVGIGRIRLPRRPARLHPRRRGRAQPQGLGDPRRPVPGAGRTQQRRADLQNRRHGGGIRGASFDVRAARQAARRRLCQ